MTCPTIFSLLTGLTDENNMKIKVIREMDAGYDRRELLMEVDDEVLAVYRAAMNVEEFDQDSFNEWLEKIIHSSTDGEDWKYE